jgi:hemoglobin/transferrin/lactoferrin receptor protein
MKKRAGNVIADREDSAESVFVPAIFRRNIAGRKMRHLLLGVLLPAAAFLPPLRGTAASTNLEAVVVSARGYATALSDTPGGVGYVDERIVFEDQPASVPDLSKHLSGVSKNSDSAWGSDINIRGLSRDSVVVLVDGTRLETANAINARLGMIDPTVIERVEVLKGPVSSLYGSGTIGGVVNIITKGGGFREKEELTGGFSTGWKSNPEGFSSSLWGGWSSVNDYLYAIQTYRDFDSCEDGDGDTVRNSQFRDRQTTVKAGHRLNDNHSVEAQVQYYEGENIGIPGGNDQLPSAGQEVTYPVSRRGLIDLSYIWTPSTGNLEESRVKLYYHFNHRRVRIDHFPAATPVAEVRPHADHDTLGGQWQNRIQLENHTLVAGIDIWRRTLESDRDRELKNGKIISDKPLPDSSFLSAGGFGEDSWSVSDRLTLNYGARADWINVENDSEPGRWDDENEEDVSWNAHLGAVYDLSDQLSAKAILSSGYRAPSLEERYSVISLAGAGTRYGDPELDPETSIFTEWGLDWNSENLSASASVFLNELDDMIVVEDIAGTADQTYANVSEAEIFGAEFSADWRILETLSIYGNFSYLNGRDTETNDDLPGIAPINGLVGLRTEQSNGLWASLETEFAAEQDQTPGGTDETAGWQTVNARAGYDFTAARTKQTVYVGVDNLFDESYSNYLSSDRSGSVVLYEPGRSFSIGWQVEF